MQGSIYTTLSKLNVNDYYKNFILNLVLQVFYPTIKNFITKYKMESSNFE